ncbi:MAG: chemotaxis protein CheW [Methylococcaceae bacterium]|nr:chemotaxis protein CheW [Methylococcaceae bacterium]
MSIDWRQIERRLEEAQVAIEHAWEPTAEETKRILRERAKGLAREHGQTELADERIEVVEFILSSERYAIESRTVREVYPLENLAQLPCTPAFVLGIINLRGEILSVIDIKKFFDLPENELTNLNKVIVLQSEKMVLGILTDAIGGVRSIPLADIQPSLPTLTGIREEFLKGITSDRTIILDADKLMVDKKIIVEEQVPE